MSEVGAWRIEALAALPERQGGRGGKKVPKAWRASMVSVANERLMVQTILKAWPGADEAAVRVGGIVRAERREYLPEGATVPKVSYMVIGQKAARAMEAKERMEQRMAALEARAEKLERFVGILLRERTEEAEKRVGGDPAARHPALSPQEVEAAEAYCRELADPERKYPLVPRARVS